MNSIVNFQAHHIEPLTLADKLFRSGMLHRNIKSPEAAFALMLAGSELGLGPWQSLSTINVIDGKPTISPQLMLALAERSGQLEDIAITGDDTQAKVVIKRKGRTAHTETFTIADAGRLKLTEKYNWQQQPKVMLRWRCVAAAMRMVFPDVILGMYTPEEMGADVTVSESGEMTVTVEPVSDAPAALDKLRSNALPTTDVTVSESGETEPPPAPPRQTPPPAVTHWHEKTQLFTHSERIGVQDADQFKALTGKAHSTFADANAALEAVTAAMSTWTTASRVCFNRALEFHYGLKLMQASDAFKVPDWDKLTSPLAALKYCKSEATVRNVPVMGRVLDYQAFTTSNGETKVMDFTVALNGDTNGILRLFGGRTALRKHLGDVLIHAVRLETGDVQAIDDWTPGQYRLNVPVLIAHEGGKITRITRPGAPAPAQSSADDDVIDDVHTDADAVFNNLPGGLPEVEAPKKAKKRAAQPTI